MAQAEGNVSKRENEILTKIEICSAFNHAKCVDLKFIYVIIESRQRHEILNKDNLNDALSPENHNSN